MVSCSYCGLQRLTFSLSPLPRLPRIYYQHSNDRLSACPLTIHALLHIADSIEATGPVWAAWAFPIERYCGTIASAVKSRRFPWASIDRRITEIAQLMQIKLRYDLKEELLLDLTTRPIRGRFTDPACAYIKGFLSIFSDILSIDPTCALLPPHCDKPIEPSLFEKIIISLSTRFDQTMAAVRQLMKKASVDQWGKVQRLDGGDTMSASALSIDSDDCRDPTFVRVHLNHYFAHSLVWLTFGSYSTKCWLTYMLIIDTPNPISNYRHSMASYNISSLFTSQLLASSSSSRRLLLFSRRSELVPSPVTSLLICTNFYVWVGWRWSI